MTVQPGWYPDPSGGSGRRYWDGAQWTEFRNPEVLPSETLPSPSASKSKIPTSVQGIIAFVVLALAMGSFALISGGNDDERASGGEPSPTLDETRDARRRGTGPTNPKVPVEPAIAPVGAAVRDGKFEFQVVDMALRASVGRHEARGVYVLVKLRVVNIGTEEQTFFPQNQKLIDTSGREYEADYMASYSINDDVILDLNPGLYADPIVPFDVPPGISIECIELHDSAFSRGVKLALPS